ncbi:MAG TPA: hypothetical protein DDW52_03120 [Planctomycetaceae bacterium]|nr:hypothetical protein [Planctomycetaceae bacterium]
MIVNIRSKQDIAKSISEHRQRLRRQLAGYSQLIEREIQLIDLLNEVDNRLECADLSPSDRSKLVDYRDEYRAHLDVVRKYIEQADAARAELIRLASQADRARLDELQDETERVYRKSLNPKRKDRIALEARSLELAAERAELLRKVMFED